MVSVSVHKIVITSAWDAFIKGSFLLHILADDKLKTNKKHLLDHTNATRCELRKKFSE